MIRALRAEMPGPVFALWAVATAVACGHIAYSIYAATRPEAYPYSPPTEAWQCGLDSRDYLPGNCGETVWFSHNRDVPPDFSRICPGGDLERCAIRELE